MSDHCTKINSQKRRRKKEKWDAAKGQQNQRCLCPIQQQPPLLWKQSKEWEVKRSNQHLDISQEKRNVKTEEKDVKNHNGEKQTEHTPRRTNLVTSPQCIFLKTLENSLAYEMAMLPAFNKYLLFLLPLPPARLPSLSMLSLLPPFHGGRPINQVIKAMHLIWAFCLQLTKGCVYHCTMATFTTVRKHT